MFKVVVYIGSESDAKALAEADIKGFFDQILGEGSWQLNVMSAHRHREVLEGSCTGRYQEGTRVFIGIAGLFPALPGEIRSILPADVCVIGVPLSSSYLTAEDGLKGLAAHPEGTTIIPTCGDKLGLKHAAWIVCQIVAQTDGEVRSRLLEYQAAFMEKKPPIEDANLGDLLEGGT